MSLHAVARSAIGRFQERYAEAAVFGVDRITLRPPFLDLERYGSGEHGYHDLVNNAAFQAARAYLSSGTPAGGLIGARCATPTIQIHRHYVYRRIAIATAAVIGKAISCALFARPRALLKRAPQ
jgi:hypothetical protein